MERIKIETKVNAPIEKIWDYWVEPEHIVQWSHASDDWHTPRAENDIRTGGKFVSRMEARDGSMGFDFGGVYDEVIQYKRIAYTMGDDRSVTIDFNEENDGVRIVQSFDPESRNSREMQRDGWQAILDNFKKYVEGN